MYAGTAALQSVDFYLEGIFQKIGQNVCFYLPTYIYINAEKCAKLF
jgi:hypothetical protein